MNILIILIILAAILGFGFFAFWWGRGFIRRRHAHEQLWQDAFPSDDFGNVDQMLTDICDAFMISRKHRYALRPSDELMAIYRETTAMAVDSMEFEHLLQALEQHFNISEQEFRSMLEKPLTVGDLVRRIAQPLGKEKAPNPQRLQGTRLPARP